MANTTVAWFKRRGFDLTKRYGKYFTPLCSQCEVLVICGVACHETGCPNARSSRS